MDAIEVRGLRKEYRRGRGAAIVAVDGLELGVPAGGVFGFLGPNGSGKTTTIRCLLGLARPTAGSCRVLGADSTTDHRRVQDRTGSMIETQALFPGFTGRRNLTLLAGMRGIGRGVVDGALERVGLAGRADDLLGTYSLGMRQRLGLAAALLKDPEVLILDEPANGLDPAGIREVRALLRALGDEGRTVFVSSHVLAEVQQLCDRVAVLSRGRCVAAGPVRDVMASVGAHGVLVRLDDLDGGLVALAEAGLPTRVRGGAIHVDVPADDAPEVARALARRGCWPRELRPAGASLEEAFLALTRQDEQDEQDGPSAG